MTKLILTKLAVIRKSKGLTQKALAETLLFSERTIISWENGSPTTENNARRIAIALKVKLKDLQ